MLTKKFRRGRLVNRVRDTDTGKLLKEVRGVLSLRQVSYFTKRYGHRGINHETWRLIEAGERLPSPADVEEILRLSDAPSRDALIDAVKRDKQQRINEQYERVPQEEDNQRQQRVNGRKRREATGSTSSQGPAQTP